MGLVSDVDASEVRVDSLCVAAAGVSMQLNTARAEAAKPGPTQPLRLAAGPKASSTACATLLLSHIANEEVVAVGIAVCR